MPRRMTEREREAFLAEPRTAIISVASGDDRPPLAVPIHYAYEPGGDITFYTDTQRRTSRKTTLIARAGGGSRSPSSTRSGRTATSASSAPWCAPTGRPAPTRSWPSAARHARGGFPGAGGVGDRRTREHHGRLHRPPGPLAGDGLRRGRRVGAPDGPRQRRRAAHRLRAGQLRGAARPPTRLRRRRPRDVAPPDRGSLRRVHGRGLGRAGRRAIVRSARLVPPTGLRGLPRRLR